MTHYELFAKMKRRTLAAEMPQVDVTRHKIFGSPSQHLKILTTDPEKVLALARTTLK